MNNDFVPLPMDVLAVLRGMRSFGYSFEDAVADIIDNSISAGAKKVTVSYSTANPDNMFVAFQDDGCGMTLAEITKALCFGNHVTYENAKVALGKFGMGLKTASLSQCRRVTVASKKCNVISAICLDLGLVEEKGELGGRILSKEEIQAVKAFRILDDVEHGTVVLWSQFDRFASNGKKNSSATALTNKMEVARLHVALVFHEFYDSVAILFNNMRVPRRDPFLMGAYPRRQEGAPVDLGHQVVAIPYAMPYETLLSDEERELVGMDGSESYFNGQGVYIYRNRRLIHHGGWFRLKSKNENYQYARVRIDLTDSDDEIWMLDVRKATVQLPDAVKASLRSAIEDALSKSRRICKEENEKKIKQVVSDLWKFKHHDDGSLDVTLNVQETICKCVVDNSTDDGAAFRKFVQYVEDHFPWKAIEETMKG